MSELRQESDEELEGLKKAKAEMDDQFKNALARMDARMEAGLARPRAVDATVETRRDDGTQRQ